MFFKKILSLLLVDIVQTLLNKITFKRKIERTCMKMKEIMMDSIYFILLVLVSLVGLLQGEEEIFINATKKPSSICDVS